MKINWRIDVTNKIRIIRNRWCFSLIQIEYFRFHEKWISNLREQSIQQNLIHFFSFQVAEDKLDIPSLLDAEDMLASEEPDKFSVVTYLAQFYHLFKTADSNISPNVSLHLGTSSESESEAATPVGTPTSEKKNFSTSEKKSFDRNDLIERYGEEIFQNNKASKCNQFSSLFL